MMTCTVIVSGCSDCPFIEFNPTRCAKDESVFVPLLPESAGSETRGRVAHAIPAGCPLWRKDILVTLRRRDTQKPTGEKD